MTDSTGAWVGVERDVVTVFGTDARSYLHGQVSQDVQSLAAGESRWTLVLAPNGRVEVLARILCVADDRFELDTEAGYGDVLAARLNRFRIRVKTELEQSTIKLHVNCERSEQEPVARDRRSRTGWWDTGDWLDVLPAGASAGATIDDFERARVVAGWPAMGSEILPGERIPAEVGVAPVAVNFTKGCYPGQELVERMDSRQSQAPRSLRVVTVDAATKPGDPVIDPADPTGPPIGEFTSVAGDRALAYVRRGAAVGDVPGPTNS